MKHVLIFIGALFLNPFLAEAQLYQATSGTVKYDEKERPCIHVKVESEPKELKGAWQDFIKDNYDVKLKGFGFLANKDILEAEKVKFEQISQKEMNFYTKFSQENESTEMCVFASLGYDIFINKNEYPEEYRTMKNIVERFIGQYVPAYYEKQVDETQGELSDLEKEIGNLESDISNNKKQVEKNRKEIEKLQSKNEKLAEELRKKEKKLSEIQELLEKKKGKLKKAKDELQ